MRTVATRSGPACKGRGFGILCALLLTLGGVVNAAEADLSPYSTWKRGPSPSPSAFPIGVWLQPPAKAAQYRDAGFNLYVGLWEGPTEDQLAALKRAGMSVICALNDTARRHLDDPVIVGWMHGDEPDNAQSLGSGKGYGPPILPAQICADYAQLRRDDPSRPILLNLGQGVAWDDWHGRGVRTRHPEDYKEYVQGGDIVSFDIYPVVHDKPAVNGQLWYVARGVQRLVEWTGGQKPVWNCIECTRISNPNLKATPHQVRAEVWMSLIHGSRGLIYFVHEWQPRFRESALLEDPAMLAAVTGINRQIQELAPILNHPAPVVSAKVTAANPDVPVAAMTRVTADTLYLFAVGMRDGETSARFDLPVPVRGPVEEIGTSRRLPIEKGGFSDKFGPWDVRLYRVSTGSADSR